MTAKLQLVRADDGFDLPRLGQEDGSAFGWEDRWSLSMTPDGKYVTDLSDWEARDMMEMLTKDYKARQMENVLTLPLSSAEYTIVAANGDKGEAAWLKSFWETDAFSGGCRTSLDQIIALMTSAFYFKRAYFEKVWAKGVGPFAGKYVYSDVAWRPQTTCRLMRDPQNGRFKGFEQQPYFIGKSIRLDKWPIQINASRAFVYTHGTRRDPLNGSSDMEIAYWAWKTKQKILMLWFQFLQSVSLPRIVVKGNTTEEARQVAGEIARMKASGVLPVGVSGGPDSVTIDALDVSGKGAEQFMSAISWLDNAATQSILAGFLNLTNRGTPMDGVGSFALSKDASDFFLQSLEAKAREMEDQVRNQLFAPLIFHNFGPNAAIPKLQFEPLNDIDKDASLELLKSAMAAPPGGPVPTQFIADLAGQVATYLGLDGDSTKEAFKTSFDAAAAQAQAKLLQEQGAAGATPTASAVAGLAGAVGAAHKAVQTGIAPGQATKQAFGAAKADQRASAAATKAHTAGQQLMAKHAKNALKAKTGGEVSLSVPDEVNLAGFDPAEPRVGGKWSASSGGQGKTAEQRKRNHAHLLVEKAQLEAEARHLREAISAFSGKHAGAAGVHRGQAGVHKGPKNAGPTKGAKAGPTPGAKAAKGSAPVGHGNLAGQVAHLEKVVEHLKRELVTLQQRAAKRRKGVSHGTPHS